ncbi:MAG TPA: protein kinase [Ktedonobacterales bacterium]|nr:protein kinase [Ktedonobacterales bacterium]
MAGNIATGSDMQLSGRQLARRYTLSDELAPGALSRIVRGDDMMLRRPVIVKAIPPEFVEVYTEAMRATSALTHPATIAFYDAFYEDGWLLLVQEAVHGQALSRYLRQGVPSERAVNLGLQLAHLLAYAHHRDVVHGDLTPTAILVDRQATVRVNNFGLPPNLDYFLAEGGDELLPLLTDGSPYGDVLALGLLLRQLLSNAELAGTEHGARQIRADVPRELARLVTRCITPHASDAIAEVATLASALEEIGEQLVETRHSLSTDTPAALRVAHAVAAEQARWSSEQTVAGVMAPQPIERSSHEVGSRFSPLTDLAEQSDGAVTRAANEADLAVAPRLRLPARPWPTPPLYHEAGRGPAPIYHKGENVSARSVGLGAVLVVSAVLFIIFFLIGFLGPFSLGGH